MMRALVSFMNGPIGRVARIGLGVALIAVGFGVVGGTGGMILAAVGLVPIALGVSGHCLLEFLAPKSHSH
jgi:hypothetical protein